MLAASPELIDPNFHQSLVYIVDHNEEGALGLVMTRPTGNSLGAQASGPEMSERLAGVPLYHGGPVQPGNILLAVFIPAAAGRPMTCEVGLGVDQVEAHLAAGTAVVIAFSGYAGWSSGQLEQEVREGAWKVSNPENALLDARLAPGMWTFFISGDRRWRPLIPHLPDHPEWN